MFELRLAAATGLCLVLAACTPAPASQPTQPVASPSVGSAGNWETAAPPPLEPRYDALAFAADGAYYILGGLSGRTNQALTDAARYDPIKDTWTRIGGFGKALTLVTSHSSAAVLDGRLYVTSPQDLPLHGPNAWSANGDTHDLRAFAALDLATGAWTSLPAPPRIDPPARTHLVAGARGLFAFQEGPHADGTGEGDFAGTDFGYDLGSGRWTPLPAVPLSSGLDRYATQLDAGHVLVQSRHDDGAAPSAEAAVLDLATGEWAEPIALARYAEFFGGHQTYEDPRPTVAGDRVVWTAELPNPDETTTRAVLSCPAIGLAAGSVAGCGVTLLEPAYTQELTVQTGGLAARFTAAGDLVVPRARLATTTAVEAWYHLYEPGTQRLLTVPALPGVRYADSSTAGRYVTVLASASESVLACFGSDEDPGITRATNWHQGCHLLRVSP